MRIRKSFFLRWLLFRDEAREEADRSVIDIEHIQSGQTQRVSSLEEASLWMSQVDTENAKTENDDDDSR